jgi:hypothetical protein
MHVTTKLTAAAILISVIAFAQQAHAADIPFALKGQGFNISGTFTIVPNVAPADPDLSCGTAGHNPCRTDPVGAFSVTNITGTFSDAADHISNATITGIVPINPAGERDPTFDPLVPSSLSFIDFPGGSLTYNNLFFPDGSPIDCDYPFSGTFADVFGIAFTVQGGYTAVLWGDGDVPGFGLTYGVGVTDGTQGLAYAFQGVSGFAAVPEASTWAMMLLGFAGVGGLVRARQLATAAA